MKLNRGRTDSNLLQINIVRETITYTQKCSSAGNNEYKYYHMHQHVYRKVRTYKATTLLCQHFLHHTNTGCVHLYKFRADLNGEPPNKGILASCVLAWYLLPSANCQTKCVFIGRTPIILIECSITSIAGA